MTIERSTPPLLLVPGHWLGAWAWDEVVEQLTAAGRNAIPLTLPGLDASDPDRARKTLDDQAAAIVRAMEAAAVTAERPAVLVAHSGANAPVSLVLDRHRELVGRVVWIDSGPVADGTVFAPDAPEDLVELPLPSFEVLAEQASLAGLSDDVLERFRARAVPEPGPVLRQRVALHNDDNRRRIPTTLVCCSLPSAQLMERARAGHPMFAPVTELVQLHLVDLPTGHWPMWSRPADLARVLADAALQPDPTAPSR